MKHLLTHSLRPGVDSLHSETSEKDMVEVQADQRMLILNVLVNSLQHQAND